MTLQRIQIGTYPNDGTGDTLRVSFTKVNENFLDVYNTLGYQANNANDINAAAHVSTNVIFRHANSAFDQANASYFYSVGVDNNLGYAFLNANLAFSSANGVIANTRAAFSTANASFNFANNLSIQVNDSVIGLRARTNLIYSIANNIIDLLNGGFSGSNLIYSFANTIHAKVNVNFALTNAAFGRANAAYLNSNAAFNAANAAFNYVTSMSTGLPNIGGVTFAGSLYFPLGSKIGLGTNSPGGTLHVKSNLDNPLVVLEAGGTQDLSLRFRRNNVYQWFFNNENNTNDLVFSSLLSPSILRMTNNGDVGLGITPQAKFDVNGNSIFRGSANFSNFITVNIPSAQLGKDGLSVTNPDGIGIHGKATRTVGGVDGSIGILGDAVDGTGVRGVATTGTGVQGVSSSSIGTQGTSLTGPGVFGTSKSNYGVFGISTSSRGVSGVSTLNQGVHGESNSGDGVNGVSSSGKGGSFISATGIPLWAGTSSDNAKFYIDNSGDMYADAGYGSTQKGYLCRSWGNINTAASIATPAKISKSSGTYIATVTKANHGLAVGRFVYLTGTDNINDVAINWPSSITKVLYSGLYKIVSLTTNTFTIDVQAGVRGDYDYTNKNFNLFGADIDCYYWQSTIRNSRNVSSVTEVFRGQWVINFAEPMPDDTYSVVASAGLSKPQWPWLYNAFFNDNKISISYISRYGFSISYNPWPGNAPEMISFAVFR